MPPKTKTIHVICGPTASGKSGLALDMAAEKNGVIINADSMQVYDGLPTLTAQPSEEDKASIPHRLYGARHPNEACSAGNWREMAQPVIVEALDSGQTPIVVGGSGLYVKALIEGLSPIPDIPDEIRNAANQKQAALGNPAFHAELEKRDPVMAQRFHPYHTARLIRAWEVLEATGKSLAEWQDIPSIPPPEDWVFEITIAAPARDILYERCNTRFVAMTESGALDEVKDHTKQVENGVIQPGVPLNKALGLKPLQAYLKGDISKNEAVEQGQNETRQYAKRQVTWFRHQIKPARNIMAITTKNI